VAREEMGNPVTNGGHTMLSFESVDDCRRFMERENIRQFDVKFCDLQGSWHHITLMREALDVSLLEKGIGFDSSSIPKFHRVQSGDMTARPDLSSCFLDTTFEEATLSSVADIVEADSGKETALDPRTILRRAIGYMREKGYGDKFICAPELEFYLFADAGFMNNTYESWFRVSSPGVGRPGGVDDVGASERINQGKGYMAVAPKDLWQNERSTMATRLTDCGLPVRYHHLEVGAAGQQEIEFGFMDALTAADGILLGKYLIRNIAVQEGIEACFMPKPLANAAGNGLHIHFRVLKEEKNLFSGDGYGGMSEFGKHFIGGVLAHGRSLLSFTSPSTNSYRRLMPGYETPVRFFYSVANREAAIRIPKYSTGKHTRCEFRPGDPMMNPYLAISALLMAGLDGVERKIDPEPLHFGPFDGTPPEIDPGEHPECFLVKNLEEALESLKKDSEFLQSGGVFDKRLIDNYISFKQEEEINPLLRTPHTLEYEMYWGL